MRKVLLLLLTMLSAVFCTNAQDLDGAYSDIYLRGSVNNWLQDYLPNNPENVPDVWKGAPNEDGTVYVWDWAENPQKITNEFKFADYNWGTHNYGVATNESSEVDLGVLKKVARNSNTNFVVPTNAEWTISKITLDLNSMTVLFEGESQERVYDPDNDYGVKVRFDWNHAAGTESLVYDMTFEGSGKYSLYDLEITDALALKSFKIADESYADINFGGNYVILGETIYLVHNLDNGLKLPDLFLGTIVDITVNINSFDEATILFAIKSEPAVDAYIWPVGDETFSEEYKATSYSNGVYTWDWSDNPKEMPAIFRLADMNFSLINHGAVPVEEGETENILSSNTEFKVVSEGDDIKTNGTINAQKVEFDYYSSVIIVYAAYDDLQPQAQESFYIVGDISGDMVLEEFKSSSKEEFLNVVSFSWDFDEPIDMSGDFIIQSQDGSFKYSSGGILWSLTPITKYLSMMEYPEQSFYPIPVYGRYKISSMSLSFANYEDRVEVYLYYTITEVVEPYYFDLYVYGSCTGWQFDEAFKASADGNGVYTWTWPEETPFSLSGAFLFGQNGWWQQYNVTMDSEPLFIPAGESETQITLNFNNTVQGKDIPVTGTILVTEMVLDAKTNQLTVKGKLDESKPLIPDFYIRGFEMNNELNGYINEEAIPGKWRGTPNDDYSVYTWDWTGLPEEDRILYGNFEIADMGWLNRFSAVPGLSVEFLVANKPYDIAIGDGSFRIPVSPDYEITVSTITMNLDDMTLLVEGTEKVINDVSVAAAQVDGLDKIQVTWNAALLNGSPAADIEEDMYVWIYIYDMSGSEVQLGGTNIEYGKASGEKVFDIEPGTYNVEVAFGTWRWDEELNMMVTYEITMARVQNVVIKSVTPTAVDEQAAPVVYSINGTVYASEPFVIYDIAGRDVTSFNGMLEGMYIVELEGGLKVKVLTE